MGKFFKFLSCSMILLFLVGLTLTVDFAQQKSERSTEKEEPYVYTNADLEKYAEEEESTEIQEDLEEVTYEAVDEMIKKIEEPERVRKWKESKLKAAEERVQNAEMRLDYLNKKKASIQNPLLPRPKPTKEDEQEEAGMDNVERLERTEKQIEEAEEDLKKCEEDLEKLKIAFREAGI